MGFERSRTTLLLSCLNFRLNWSLLFFHPTAQPNPPKIHEGWWAYKEVVQGSFVPGKPRPTVRNTVTHWNRILILFHKPRRAVRVIPKSERIAYLRLRRATLPPAMDLFSHSGETSSPLPHPQKWRRFADWLTAARHIPSYCVSACKANYFWEIVFFCWAEGLFDWCLQVACVSVSKRGGVYACEDQVSVYACRDWDHL